MIKVEMEHQEPSQNPDIPVTDCNRMSDEDLLKAVLQAGAETESGDSESGSK